MEFARRLCSQQRRLRVVDTVKRPQAMVRLFNDCLQLMVVTEVNPPYTKEKGHGEA